MARVYSARNGDVIIYDTEDEDERLMRAHHRRVNKHLKDWDPLSLHNNEPVPASAPESPIEEILDEEKRKARAHRRARERAEEREAQRVLDQEIAEALGPEAAKSLDEWMKTKLF